MKTMRYTQAIDSALAQAMVRNPNIVVFGEDAPLLRRDLRARFGSERILGAPISESAFVGAAVSAAMGGLRPVAEVYMVDFLGVCMDALINHAAKVSAFSGGTWNAPVVIRAPAGGGYGDGGQHEQALWGWLAHIPGLNVAVPSCPADAGGLMTQALEHDGPTLFLEHKLLSETLIDFLGSGGRSTVSYDVPEEGTRGTVPRTWEPIPFGKGVQLRKGDDVTLISVGVGVHRCLQAAYSLSKEGVEAGVLDLRTVSPLDTELICLAVKGSGRVVVVDEDYTSFGLTGEIAAVLAEAGVTFTYARVAADTTIPYDPVRELETLPNPQRIVDAVRTLIAV